MRVIYSDEFDKKKNIWLCNTVDMNKNTKNRHFLFLILSSVFLWIKENIHDYSSNLFFSSVPFIPQPWCVLSMERSSKMTSSVAAVRSFVLETHCPVRIVNQTLMTWEEDARPLQTQQKGESQSPPYSRFKRDTLFLRFYATSLEFATMSSKSPSWIHPNISLWWTLSSLCSYMSALVYQPLYIVIPNFWTLLDYFVSYILFHKLINS